MRRPVRRQLAGEHRRLRELIRAAWPAQPQPSLDGVAAELARTVRRAELAQAPEHDGIKAMASWLRGHARLSPAAANQVVRNGRALEQLPAVAARHGDGQLTAEQVTVIAPITRPASLVPRTWRPDGTEILVQ